MERLFYLKASVRMSILTAMCFVILVGGLGFITYISWLFVGEYFFFVTYGCMAVSMGIVLLSKGAVLSPLLTWAEYLKKKRVREKTVTKGIKNILLGTASTLSLVGGWCVYLYQSDKQEKHIFVTLGLCFLAFVIFIIAVNHAKDVTSWIIKKIQDKDILTTQ